MERTIIWVIDIREPDSSVEIEIFSGRNKFTKAGFFSGPLRREDIKNFSTDYIVRFVLSLKNVTQIGKNKFKLHKNDAVMLFDYFRQQSLETVYCRLPDKKLHHVNQFVVQKNNKVHIFPSYESKTGKFMYSLSALNVLEGDSIVTIPKANLFLYQEGKNIRGCLTFSYHGVEVQANLSQETIELSNGTVFRNLQYERNIQEVLYSLGGHQSFKNEILFSSRRFFKDILPEICKQEITLYWGKEKQIVSKSSISCNISYDIEWFSVSGEVRGDNTTYVLSDLLRSSKGKSYVKIDNGILFLPEELRRIALYPIKKNQIQIAAHKLTEVNDIAEKFEIRPSNYLEKFLDFSLYSCTLNKKLDMTLKPYQKTGSAWILTLYKNRFGGCLADDMGLGKTLQTIAFICCQERNTDYPVLIVVPKVILYNWQRELVRFAENKEVIIAYGDFDYSDIRERDVIYVTTYDTLINRKSDFTNIRFDTVILDEAQYVKNYRTKRYKVVKSVRTNFMLALTGTPIENNIEELWSLLNLLNPGLFGSHAAFMEKFRDVHTDFKQIELLRKLISPFVMRRTKEQVLKELPEKKEEYIYCEMEHAQRTLYNILHVAAQNEIKAKPSRYTIKDNAVVLQALLYLREVCSEPQLLPYNLRSGSPCDSCKFEMFKDYSKRIMDNTGKIIVYSLFPRVLRKLESWCEQQGWRTFYIDGTVNQRQQLVDEFEKADQGVFLISLKAGGVGLNLVSCQYVIIYDPWWNSAAEQQAANRVYRIGQGKSVFIYHFLVKDTIEEKIYQLQQKKENLSLDVLEKMNCPERLSMNDIYQLLL